MPILAAPDAGTGGIAVAHSSSSVTSGSGGKTGTGGGDAGGCTTSADCPGSDNGCAIVTCEPTTHTCVEQDVADGGLAITDAGATGTLPNACQLKVCNGSGNGTPVVIAGSCEQNGGSVCGDPAGPNAGTCIACNVDQDCHMDGGMGVCGTGANLGTCVDCNVPTDCSTPGDLCTQNLCVSSSCGNHVQDPGETDVDCGGPCPPCDDNEHCLLNKDCQSDDCNNPGSGRCTPASCNDTILNENETDVDCGGPICGVGGEKCGTGQKCGGPAYGQRDCQSFNCEPTAVDAGAVYACQAPTCNDGLQNGSETDVDCGGPVCVGCPVGDKCNGDADCSAPEGCDKNTKRCVT